MTHLATVSLIYIDVLGYALGPSGFTTGAVRTDTPPSKVGEDRPR